jgi:hypothetical protein
MGANGSVPGYPQPGNPINPNGLGANQAQQMIQQILTSPRPGGMPTGNGQSPAIGGGIAGVATNADAVGIMVYNDHSNYKEWEFIFDPTKVRPLPNPVSGATGTPAAQMGSMGGSQIGTPVSSMDGSGTGASASGFGGASSAGSGFGGSGYGGMPTGGPPPKRGARDTDGSFWLSAPWLSRPTRLTSGRQPACGPPAASPTRKRSFPAGG